MIARIVAWGWLICCASWRLWGLDPDRLLSQYAHRHWSTEDGLPQSSVIAINQTADGFLWFGTQEGLVRFDGRQFKVFDNRNSKGLRNHFVNALFIDSHRQLWVATRGGAFLQQADDFKAAADFSALSDPRIYAIAETPDGSMWFATNQGVARLYKGSLEIMDEDQGIPSPAVRALLVDGDRLWIGTRQGLCSWHQDTGIQTHDELDMAVWSLFIDQRDRLWIGSRNSLYVRQGQQLTEHPVFREKAGESIVLDFAQDQDGLMWIGTSLGIIRSHRDRFDEPRPGTNLDKLVVRSLFVDREQNLWLGSGWSGLHRISDSFALGFSREEGLLEGSTWAIGEAPIGRIWVANDRGINAIENGRVAQEWSQANGFPAQFIRSMATAPDGSLWIGTRNNGAFIFDGKSWTQVSRDQGLPSQNVRAFAFRSDGSAVVATFGGGLALVDHNYSATPWGPDLQNGFVMGLAQDLQGRLWVGTDGDGAYLIDGENIRTFGVSDGLTYPRVLNFLMDDGYQWLTTEGGGIFLVDGDRFHALTSRQGLFDDVVFSILRDDLGFLWCSCNRGLFRVNEQQAADTALGFRDRVDCDVFGLEDGLRSVEFNFGGTQSGFTASDGRLWFPSSRGAVVIDPALKPIQLPNPTPVLLDTLINGSAGAFVAEVAPALERLEIRFTAPTFYQTDRISFAYKLEGYDRDWTNAGLDRTAHYTKLPPSRYQFRLRASRNGQDWTEMAAPWTFRVKPKFHETKAFYALIIAVTAFLVINAIRLRSAQVHLRETELRFMVAERTQALEHTNQALLETQNQLIETAHTAGMAEVATQVLHNVGNAMNSINVSGQLLSTQCQSIQPEFVMRVSQLLRDHPDWKADQRTGRALDGLVRFAESLTHTRDNLQHEITELRARIDHVNEIIHAQQATASGARLLENVSIGELVDQAIKIQGHTIEKRSISIRRCDLPIAHINIEKAKLLQVLVNVLKNACESFDLTPTDRRVVEISIGQASNLQRQGLIVVTIADTGLGIAAGQDQRIFNQGYTTKKHGHGFGLHFCANAMTELGGEIGVYSRGEGCGTEFTMVIPDGQARMPEPATWS